VLHKKVMENLDFNESIHTRWFRDRMAQDETTDVDDAAYPSIHTYPSAPCFDHAGLHFADQGRADVPFGASSRLASQRQETPVYLDSA